MRDNVSLPVVYQKVTLLGVEADSSFAEQFARALEAAQASLVTDNSQASSVIKIMNYKEGKKVAGYGKDREVREFLIFLKFDYQVLDAKAGQALLPQGSVNVDKTQIYDSQFVLGKIEEEKLIREDLRRDAIRQMLLRLQYGSR